MAAERSGSQTEIIQPLQYKKKGSRFKVQDGSKTVKITPAQTKCVIVADASGEKCQS